MGKTWRKPLEKLLEESGKTWKTVKKKWKSVRNKYGQLWKNCEKSLANLWPIYEKRWNTIEKNAHFRLYHNKFMCLEVYVLYWYFVKRKHQIEFMINLCTPVASACVSLWYSVYGILLYICIHLQSLCLYVKGCKFMWSIIDMWVYISIKLTRLTLSIKLNLGHGFCRSATAKLSLPA